jgi:TrmH family RNA methyltransferase
MQYHTNISQHLLLFVGTEATGLTQEWREAATQNIIIPAGAKLTV